MDQKTRLIYFFERKSKRRMKVGRPRLRWLDDAENDLREIKLKRWMQKQTMKKDWYLP
jgi:hypothetical protein